MKLLQSQGCNITNYVRGATLITAILVIKN